MILDEIKYTESIKTGKEENKIEDSKEDGYTHSSRFRFSGDVRVWEFPQSYLYGTQKDEIEAFDETYKTSIPFLIKNPDTGDIMSCKLQKRLKPEFDPSYPNRYKLEGFTVREDFVDWE